MTAAAPSTGPLFNLQGKLALVTGATRGIGWAAAQALGRQGARVLINGRDAARVADAVARAQAEGWCALPAPFDVGDLPQARAALDALTRTHGGVDILLANAGIQHRTPLLQFDQADFERVLFFNLTAQWSLARHAAAAMVQRGYGRILFTGSVTALHGRENVSAYTAAKGALHASVRQWAAELTPHGVTVNALAPGYIRTELTQALQDDKGFEQWLLARTPARRWGQPQDLAAAVVFLAAREAGFVTGQVLVVDGGLTATL